MHILLLLITSVYIANGEPCKRLVCHFTGDAQFRAAKEARFYPEDVDPTLCTHLVYRPTSYYNGRINSGPNDLSTETTVGNYEKIVDLKKQNTDLKVLLFIHTYLCTSEEFISMVTSDSSRNKLIDDIIQLLRKYKFDGLAFQCIFYDNVDPNPRSKAALSEVITALRKAFDEEKTDSDRLTLSFVAYGSKIMDENCYDVANLSQNVDWVELMALGLRDVWHKKAGHHSPLYPDADNKGYSVSTAVRHWIERKAPKDKLVIGLPASGRTFTLTSSQTDVGSPVTTGGTGPYLHNPGVLAYFEICRMMNNSKSVYHYINEQKVPYLVSGNQWVGYDDVNSLTQKVRYVTEQRLGGVSFKLLDRDDFRGTFCGEGCYPLLKAVASQCSIK